MTRLSLAVAHTLLVVSASRRPCRAGVAASASDGSRSSPARNGQSASDGREKAPGNDSGLQVWQRHPVREHAVSRERVPRPVVVHRPIRHQMLRHHHAGRRCHAAGYHYPPLDHGEYPGLRYQTRRRDDDAPGWRSVWTEYPRRKPSVYGPAYTTRPQAPISIQLFALSDTIPSDALATYQGLTDAMKGHVLASGEVVGLGQAPPGTPARS